MYTSAFKLSSELTFDTANAQLEALTHFVKHAKANVLCMDLGAITQCDSAGLALLIEMKRFCAAQKKTLKIENMPSAVVALAEFCGLGSLLTSSSE